MFKLIIFDLDGTLLDTIEDLANAVNHALVGCGCRTISIDECRRLVGRGVKNLLKDALPKEVRNDEMLAKMCDYFFPYYNAHMSDTTKPYEGITEAIEALAAKGMKLAVASNKFHKGTEELVESFFGHIDFVKVLGQREGFPIKPDAGVVFEIMKETPDIRQDEVLYCGDSEVDMQTGNNAGVKTLAVTWGFRSREQLMEQKPWRIIDNTSQICEIISGN